VVKTWITPKARKEAPSEIAGRGLFAVDKSSLGEVVAVKGGHIVSTDQLRSIYRASDHREFCRSHNTRIPDRPRPLH